MNKNNLIPIILFTGYVLLFTICAINPYDRAVWWAENVPIFMIALILFILYIKNIRFSNIAYILMSFLLFIHTIGGFYTFELVPFDWFNHLFGFERNMYDRVGHFTVGFYAIAVLEALLFKKSVNSKWVLYLFPLFAITTLAVCYEWIEWWYAVTYGGNAGAAFLGSQGDIWDAQKDMLMDSLGAVFVLVIYYFATLKRNLLPEKPTGSL